MKSLTSAWLFLLAVAIPAPAAEPGRTTYFPVPQGARPHDVAASPQPGGPVYYTAQATGRLGILDPANGKVVEIALGDRSAPHGVVVGPDGAPWITDGGQNAIVRVDPSTHAVKRFPLPEFHSATQTMPFESDHTRRAPWSFVGGSITCTLWEAGSMRPM